MSNKNNNEWVSIIDRNPDKIGWYKVKTIHGEYEACVSRTESGRLVWVIPDENIITHWKNKN